MKTPQARWSAKPGFLLVQRDPEAAAGGFCGGVCGNPHRNHAAQNDRRNVRCPCAVVAFCRQHHWTRSPPWRRGIWWPNRGRSGNRKQRTGACAAAFRNRYAGRFYRRRPLQRPAQHPQTGHCHHLWFKTLARGVSLDIEKGEFASIIVYLPFRKSPCCHAMDHGEYRAPRGLQHLVSVQSATLNSFSVPARHRSAVTIPHHRLEAFEA